MKKLIAISAVAIAIFTGYLAITSYTDKVAADHAAVQSKCADYALARANLNIIALCKTMSDDSIMEVLNRVGAENYLMSLSRH